MKEGRSSPGAQHWTEVLVSLSGCCLEQASSGVKLSPVSPAQEISLCCYVIMDASPLLLGYSPRLVGMTEPLRLSGKAVVSSPSPEKQLSWQTLCSHLFLSAPCST